MMILRVRPEIRAGIERLAKDKEKSRYGRSMAQQASTAMARWIRHNEQPHISVLADGIAMLAEEIEKQTGKSIADDGETSGVFLFAVSDLVARYTAKPDNTSDAHKRLAELSAGVVASLLDRGIDWSPDFSQGLRTTKFEMFVPSGRKAKVTP
jgi:hypothetical protein